MFQQVEAVHLFAPRDSQAGCDFDQGEECEADGKGPKERGDDANCLDGELLPAPADEQADVGAEQ